MQSFYTDVRRSDNDILYRGVEDGRRVRRRITYTPTLFVPSDAATPTEYQSHDGLKLCAKPFHTMGEARDFIDRYKGVNGFKIYGNRRFEYTFIGESHPEEVVDWNLDHLTLAYLDIEVFSDEGFPDVKSAAHPINAITLKLSTTGKYHAFGLGDYVPSREDILYTKCQSEKDLLKRFLQFWREHYPDVLTGWNVKGFDVPYLYRRLCHILGEPLAKHLSPWGEVNEKTESGPFIKKDQKKLPHHLQQQFRQSVKEQIVFDVVGIATLDYLRLFKKYAPNASQESYSLNHIAQVELGEEKLSYAEYDSIAQLSKENHQRFLEYNIKDVELVERLNQSGRLLEMALTLAYANKVNYEDVFSQVTMWDAITYNYLWKQKIVVPPKSGDKKDKAYSGAYVKDPHIGVHRWIASFVVASLYPHLIMQYNIGPDTLIDPTQYTEEMSQILTDGVSIKSMLRQRVNTSTLKHVTITPNGQFFTTTKQSFMATLMERMYTNRTVYKKQMLAAQKQYEVEHDPALKASYLQQVSRYKNLQLALKVNLNSCYGSMGSSHFRFFDIRLAEAITASGQVAIQWVEQRLNLYFNDLLKTKKVDYVIAADTDSNYLNLAPIMDKAFPTPLPTEKMIHVMDRFCQEKLSPLIAKAFEDLAVYTHAYAQKMMMVRDVLADRAIWIQKKRYILHVHNAEGVAYVNPKLVIHGLEAIKSSTPASCRVRIKDAIALMLTGTEHDTHAFIAQFRTMFDRLPVEDIAFPRSVNGLKKYRHSGGHAKGTPIHVKGSLVYNDILEQKGLTKKYDVIHEGDKIKFLYLKEPNPFHSHVMAFPVRPPKEFELAQWVDYSKQFERSFVDPIKNILVAIHWTTEPQSTLDSFFS